jgi:2'-5' RNA ligase
LEIIRSFLAFDLKEKTVLRKILNVQNILVETGANIGLVKPENIHITVRFLGNISPRRVQDILCEMKKIDFAPFEVEVKGLGVFPNLRRARVIWAGIGRGANNLREIFNQLEPRLRRLSFKPDFRGFRPHLTIARVKTGHNRNELLERLKQLEDSEFGLVKAECLELKKSVLTPHGPIYSILGETCRRT